MTTPWNMRLGSVNLTAGAEGDLTEMPPETPFRLLICGNLSGDSADRVPFHQRQPIEIDRDNFDEILGKVAPRVTLPNHANGADLTISFANLEDFEPDRLFRSLPVFEELRTLQTEVGNPKTFPQAAAKIGAWAKVPAPEPMPAKKTDEAEVLDQLLEADQIHRSSGEGEWQRFLRNIALPHLVEKPDPRQADFAVVVEHAIGAQMGAILHHANFQAVESAWRSVFLLVQRLPTDASLEVFVLDASLEELRADLVNPDPRDSVFVRTVLGRAEDRPWAAIVSLEIFGKTIADLEALASMTMLSSRVRTPILAGVAPALVGCPSLVSEPEPRSWTPTPELTAAWEMVRGMEAARYLGAVTPRFLLRLPYGKDAAQTESFAFEEMATPDHEHYLWGSGAVLAGLVLAEGFVASGWRISLDGQKEIHGLPVHVYREDGDARMKPCAEVLLRETALEVLMNNGLIVLASLRDRDGVRVLDLHSAAKESERLAGRW